MIIIVVIIIHYYIIITLSEFWYINMVLITYDKISPYTGAALQEYSRTRNKDVEAMCDLAMYNYIEVFCQFYISEAHDCSSVSLFVFTTIWHHLWCNTEKMHGIMDSICQLFKISLLKVVAFRGLTQCFLQMRSLVTSPVFLMKKKLFNLLHWLMPKTFIPLYTMVSTTMDLSPACSNGAILAS